jgi:hypothetical protein
MERRIFAVTTLALASAMMAGCGGATDDDATRLLGASPGQAQSPTQAPVTVTAAAPHLYFNVTDRLHVGGDVVAQVSLNAGAVVELEVATADSSALRFELWQAHAGGWMELLNAFDAQSGFVLTSFTAASDGTFLVHFPAPASPRDVNVHLDCDRTSGRCTADLQPGERCFEQTACSPGLACAPNDGACDPIWAGGTCVVPGDQTACEGLPASPVCGCDDLTYANECTAVASGKGMKTAGACVSSPAPTPP